MKKQVEITITGTQYYSLADRTANAFGAHTRLLDPPSENADPQTVELCTTGTLSYSRDGKIELSYDESEITGLKGSRTTFTVDKDLVTLSRTGASKAVLIFENGKRHQLFTGLDGVVPVCVDCHSMSQSLTQSGGEMRVDYSVEVAGAALERNSYRIRVDL